MIDVTLNEHEIEWARTIALLKRKTQRQVSVEQRIMDSAGEIALVGALDTVWQSGGPIIQNAGRVGLGVVVKARTQHGMPLVVSPRDRTETLYVLVTGELPEVRIVGFITGYNAKQELWLRQDGNGGQHYEIPGRALAEITPDQEDGV